jgi:predicted DCC family thiol-disulfide oxidoreductase YuxK
MSVAATYISPDQVVLPLTVYYDHSCVLCRSEIENIKARDDHDQLRMVDCSSAGFDTRGMPVDQTTLLNCIHAIDAEGRWLKATDVFVACYQVAGLPLVAKSLAIGKPLMERLYPIIVRYRHVFSSLGIHSVFNILTRRQLARKVRLALAASRSCKDGVCDIEPVTEKKPS